MNTHIFRSLLKNTLSDDILRLYRFQRKARAMAWREVRHDLLGQIFPMKPRSISYMANDICNSRCTMCLIWERKRDKELTIDEFSQILLEPLFSRVDHIGVTGGEPTLRKDLPDLFRVIATRKPKIGGASIITNAVRETEVKERVLECARICRENQTSFSVMVSLDGIGEIHDFNRGRPGNFESAVDCIKAFQQAGVATSIGCTITKCNVEYVDDLLDWALECGIPARFRVAEFIERLYNSSQTDSIRNFSSLERYHLGLFFNRAAHHEVDSSVRKTYSSIVGMLVEGKKRATGCPYHTEAVILTARAELLYCSPKSPNLGSILKKGSASSVYFNNLGKRREIREKHCDDCIHDYHVPVTFCEQAAFFLKHRRIQKKYDCSRLLQRSKKIVCSSTTLPELESLNSRRVLIVGWYGTETAGDKAILWQVIQKLKARQEPPNEILISSFFPWYTEWTKKEMNLPELKVLETYSPEFETACEKVDEVLIGGGPLMDLSSLDHMLFAFTAAARRNAIVRVESCGLGPLHNPLYGQVVCEILRLSNHVTLRDQKSVKTASQEFSCSAELQSDPADGYIRHCMVSGKLELEPRLSEPQPVVNFFLREWPNIYASELTQQDFLASSQRFEEALLQCMEYLVAEKGVHLNLMAMNTFSEGGDDRVMNRRLIGKLLERGAIKPEQISFVRLPQPPIEILQAMQRGTLNVCMRYHSVLFAEVLGAEFLAIDYTSGGKIAGYLADRAKLGRMLSLSTFTAGAWREKLEQGIDRSTSVVTL